MYVSLGLLIFIKYIALSLIFDTIYLCGSRGSVNSHEYNCKLQTTTVENLGQQLLNLGHCFKLAKTFYNKYGLLLL